MECVIGIQGQDFVLLAADTVSARSIMSMKQGKRMPFVVHNGRYFITQVFYLDLNLLGLSI